MSARDSRSELDGTSERAVSFSHSSGRSRESRSAVDGTCERASFSLGACERLTNTQPDKSPPGADERYTNHVGMVQIQPAPAISSDGVPANHDRPRSLQPVYFDDLIYDSRGELNKCTSAVLSSMLDDYWHLLSENQNYSIIEWMIDTGCSTMLEQSSLANQWLHHAQKSHMVMNGFSTASSEEADLTGTLHAYVLNVASSSPGAITRNPESPQPLTGVSIDIRGVRTADIARHNLMGLSYFCNEQGFRPNEGFTGLHKN